MKRLCMGTFHDYNLATAIHTMKLGIDQCLGQEGTVDFYVLSHKKFVIPLHTEQKELVFPLFLWYKFHVSLSNIKGKTLHSHSSQIYNFLGRGDLVQSGYRDVLQTWVAKSASLAYQCPLFFTNFGIWMGLFLKLFTKLAQISINDHFHQKC